MNCQLRNIPNIKNQIISNIRKSGQTPENFIPKIDEIKLNDWEFFGC